MSQVPPHSLEAEQSVLGGSMLNAEVAATVLSELRAEEFYSVRHRAIFSAASALFATGAEVDMISVMDALVQAGRLDEAGGPIYLSTLTDTIPSPTQAKAHCHIIRDKYRARRMIEMATSIMGRCYQGERAQYIMDDFGADFFALAADRADGARPVAEIVDDAMAAIRDVVENGRPAGAMTGFYDLDRRWNGISPGELTIIAARPAMGKTCLAVNIACNVASKGGRVLIFSLEMRDVSLINRVLSAYSGISGDAIRKGNIANSQIEQIERTAQSVRTLPIMIDNSSGLNINEIVARTKLQHLKKCVSLVVIDYLQLIRAKAENRTQEVGVISRTLKGLAKTIDAPVIVLSQLNRGVESRPDKRPKLSDLRESGEIEQDADVVAFIYRDEYYDPNSSFKGLAEVITAKQRNGPTGTDMLSFSGELSLFGNVEMNRGN